jgi:hypothetical protein
MDLFKQGKIILQLQDRNGNDLNFGDIVGISDGKNIRFYAEITYLKEEKTIAPFHTFSFHSMIKVDKLPEGVKPCNEKRYKCWYDPNGKKDNNSKDGEKYLIDWRSCERFLSERVFRIEVF